MREVGGGSSLTLDLWRPHSSLTFDPWGPHSSLTLDPWRPHSSLTFDPWLPHSSLPLDPWRPHNSLTLDPSQLPGDDGEGPHGAGCLQVQCRQEAVWRLSAAAGLQRLPQATPRLVGRAVELDGVSQDLLAQVDTPTFHQQTTLDGRTEGNLTKHLKLSSWLPLQLLA